MIENESHSDGLFGIDDESTVSRLEKECLDKDSPAFRVAVVTGLALGSGILSAAATMFASFIGFGYSDVFSGFGAGALGAGLYVAWRRSRIKKWFPQVAAAHGRCKKCGYKLRVPKGSSCPECGTAIEPSKRDNEWESKRG